MKQCHDCHAFFAPRHECCPKCKSPESTIAGLDDDAPDTWIRTRTRKQTLLGVGDEQAVAAAKEGKDKVLALPRSPAEVTARSIEKAETVVVPPRTLEEWSAEISGLEGSTSTSWMKKTLPVKDPLLAPVQEALRSGRGAHSTPTPLVLPRLPRDEATKEVPVPPPGFGPHATGPNTEEGLRHEPEEDPPVEVDIAGLEEWSLNSLAPSTGAIDHAADSVAEELRASTPENDEEGAPVKEPLSAAELRNDLVRRLLPLQTPSDLQRPSQAEEVVEEASIIVDLVAEDAPAPVAKATVVPVENRTEQPRTSIAAWIGRAATAALFFACGGAAATNASFDTLSSLAIAGLASAVLALPRHSRVSTVLVVGGLTGIFASWLTHAGVLGTAYPPTFGALWQWASLAAVGALVLWLFAAVLETSAHPAKPKT